MDILNVAKHLLLGHSCLNCKWTSRRQVVPELEVTLNVLENYKQVCYNKDYVLSQEADNMFINSFKYDKASFWTECPVEKICENWQCF